MNNSHKQSRNEVRREKRSKLSTLKRFTAIAVIGVLGAASVLSAASVSRVAYITDGEQVYTVTTTGTDTSEIIERAGLELSDFDKAVVVEESGERIDINILRAFSVKISADGGARFLDLTEGTVADALEKAEVKYTANDFITPILTTPLTEDMVIDVVRGVKVYLTCDGATNVVYVPQGKVGDALEYIGYQLCEDDDVSVDLNAQVESGMSIKVDRVEYKTRYEKEKISHTVIEEASPTLPIGQTKVKQQGRDGVLETTYTDKYVDGELKDTEQIGTKVLRKPIDEIVLVGTAQETQAVGSSALDTSVQTDVYADVNADFSAGGLSTSNSNSLGTITDISGSAFSYSKMIVGTCTAYNEPDGVTAIGTVPRVGIVAVNPNVIPYGTRLYITSADGSYVYGYAVAEDTGGACMAGDIVVDLYMDSEEACQAFGRQELCIYVLN